MLPRPSTQSIHPAAYRRHRRAPLFAGCLLALALAVAGEAQVGDLLIAPTRVLFEGTKRQAEVSLVNVGAKPAIYRIQFEQRQTNELGQMTRLEKLPEGQTGADELVRFMPRQVVIKPGDTQTVRLQLRKPSTLPDGEYRSHLVFQAVPEQMGADLYGEEGKRGVGVMLTPIYGISIPVLVRQGTLGATAAVTDLQFNASAAEGVPVASFTITRDGSCSLYGDLVAHLIDAAGKTTIVGRANGISVYPPNPLRRLRLALVLPEGYRGGGRLQVSYLEHTDERPATLAQGALDLP